MAANLSDIEEEKEEKQNLVVEEKKEEKSSLEKKEPAETEEPTVEDLLEAFKDSTFCNKIRFACPITRELMLDPVVLNGSGQSLDRSSAVQLIENALNEGKEPICPITNNKLTITVSRNKATDPSQPESYFVENSLLKSIISDSIQDFRDSQGTTYQNVPDPMIKPRDIIQSESENAELASSHSTNDPTNRNRFFTEGCQQMTGSCMLLTTIVSSVGITSCIRGMFFPETISCAQTMMLCSGSVMCCVGTILASAAALEFGGKAEAWYRGDELQVDAVTDVLTTEPLVMQEENEENGIEMQTITPSSGENDRDEDGPPTMQMTEENEEHNRDTNAPRLSPSRM